VLIETPVGRGSRPLVWGGLRGLRRGIGPPGRGQAVRSEDVSDGTFHDRFHTEARNTRRCRTQGIVQVHDFGEARIVLGLSSTPLPYIAMELVPGEQPSAIIAREGAMGVDPAASIVAQAAAALHSAARVGGCAS
jgi:serine/threonine protein kinase